MRANSCLLGRAHCNRLRNSRKGELREATEPASPSSLEVLLCVQLSGFRQCLLVSLEVLTYMLSGNHECNALLFSRNVEGISDAYRIDIEADGSTIEIPTKSVDSHNALSAEPCKN